MEKPSLHNKQQAQAFTVNDIVFLGKNKWCLTWETAFTSHVSILQVKLCYEWQKNGDHRETKLLNRNDKKPHICSLWVWLRICQQFVRIQRKNLTTTPLSIYYNDSTSSIINISSDLVTGVMRELTSKLYDMHDKDELISLFTCHLLRVGTCCTLISQGLQKE